MEGDALRVADSAEVTSVQLVVRRPDNVEFTVATQTVECGEKSVKALLATDPPNVREP